MVEVMDIDSVQGSKKKVAVFYCTSHKVKIVENYCLELKRRRQVASFIFILSFRENL